MIAERLHVPAKTTLDQRRAADPHASAWVSANAGAGKTKVLVDRVLRLLLEGTPPGRILCLTFTKAAAANMAIRVFDRLGRWVTLDDAALSDDVEELEGVRPDRARLALARRLFARSVETPGGLKIETIHAFCERILHLVPFEAEVPASFKVLDENQLGERIAQATREVLAKAAAKEAHPELGRALDVIGIAAGGEQLDEIIAAAVAERRALRDPAALDALAAELGLRPGEDPAVLSRAILEDGIPPSEWAAVAAGLERGSTNDQKLAAHVRAALAAAAPDERLAAYLCVFFTGTGPRKEIGTRNVEPGLRDRLAAERERLVPLCDRRKAALAMERTRALFTLAEAIHRRVEEGKRAGGELDFADLIEKTLAVLSRENAAAWVLYKLDRGIDHVLVDEAQDTNPEQWEILRLITAEFAAGAGASGKLRTLFAVGDPKQSIYGFQGAAPQEFERAGREWKRKIAEARLRFEDVRLTLSFRSAAAVLAAVDATFRLEAHFRGLSFADGAIGTVHESARPDAPGRVELWPIQRPEADDEPEAWTLPVDAPERSAPPVVLARRIAGLVKTWTTAGDETGRVRGPGDILILVRKRGPAFDAVIRALKEADVAVAGADRIEVGEHIAVMDLVAAGRAALLPQDDLTLAAALKSPLVGLTDDDLVRIGADRGEASLAEALDRVAPTDAAARDGAAALAAWRALSRAHGPFGFYATLLGPRGGRAALASRLGGEAADAVDAFLCFAHEFETSHTPSLSAFLARFEASAHTIKRDLESATEVRVMTVHGAKGLEAPVVILIDGCHVHGPARPLVPVRLAGGRKLPVWAGTKAESCARVAAAREAERQLALEEHNRLLYVAMTRAKDRLVVAPYSGSRDRTPEEAWCEMVRRSLVAEVDGLVREEAPDGSHVWRCRLASPHAAAAAAVAAVTDLPAPAWLNAPAVPEAGPQAPVRPSGTRGPRAERGRAAAARIRGTLVHELIERLPDVPPEHRERAGLAVLAARAPRMDPAERAGLLAEALGVIDDPRLAALFGPRARAEAAVAGRIRLGDREVPVAGQIDRLAVEDAVVFADFKTGAPPQGAPPQGYLAQLALYGRLLRAIYPGRPVRGLLVFTAGPVVLEPEERELEAALAAVA
ncbi:MAG TPA: double-strand break repair helicase AddA [Beijerinckiaceae bacterium]|nr:double-strand break repair helicase AddA [Beijerinckiaceae bacterium]